MYTPPLSIAPMIDCTDRHYRRFMRLLTKKTLLYTEMITTSAILNGDRDHLLDYSPKENPVALQLGGDDPDALAECSTIGEDIGYHEINLNVGCPSDRVQQGSFGACLMADPAKVAKMVSAMRQSSTLPVTVKCRIGIRTRNQENDYLESYASLKSFATTVFDAGCQQLIVHARIAVLGGLSPKDNRKIPPLRYEDVYRLKQELAPMPIVINGGFITLQQVQMALNKIDGVMIGRAAYDDPFIFASADEIFYEGEPSKITREQTIEAMIKYIEEEMPEVPSHLIIKHMLGLYKGQPGGKIYRRILSETMNKHKDSAMALRLAQEGLAEAQAKSAS